LSNGYEESKMSFISQRELRQYAARTSLQESDGSIKVARARGRKTVFLSHSHKDYEAAKGLKNRLKEQQVDVYIDWEDTTMPEQPDKITAQKIRDKIVECHIFMFLVTQNSVTSRWCPWEIGYADGKKIFEQILVVPTVDDQGTFHGNEYLQLYRRLIISDQQQKVAVFDPGQERGNLFESYMRTL